MLPIPVRNITNDSIFRVFAGGGASEPRGGHLSLGSGAWAGGCVIFHVDDDNVHVNER